MSAAENDEFSAAALTEARRILVPINGSDASVAALRLACELARTNKGHVYAVYIIEVARNLPIEAEIPSEVDRSEEIFDAARKALKGLQSVVEFELLQARNAGATIVDEAINSHVEAIILGVPYKRRHGEFVFSQTADFVLRHAPCQVWLCRTPLSAAAAV